MNRVAELIIARFGSSQRYWRLQRQLRQLWFGTTRRAFGVREFSTRIKEDIRGFRSLARLIVLPAGFGALSVVALHFLEPVWPHLVSDVGLSNTGVGHAVTRPVSANAYSILLQSIAAVTGVFLALYFASLNTVAATVYTTVPHDIRQLIIRDRLGNVYVRVVAYLTALAIFLLVIQATGAAPYRLALPVLAVASAFAIFSFIKLGERAFYLADPTLLVDIPAGDFRRRTVNATTRGWRWADPNIQNHYRKLAKSSLDTISSLLRISASQRHLHGEPELRLVRASCGSLAGYIAIKRRIPSESHWFGRRFSHKQWFLTTSTELEMATETETQLSPEMVPDKGWVERAVLDAMLETLASDLGDGRYDDLHSVVSYVASIWEEFGVNWEAADGFDGIARLSDFLLDAATGPVETDIQRGKLALLGAIDQLAFMPFAIEVGLYKTITALAPGQLRTRLAAADWGDPTSPYLFDLPRSAVERLESIHEGIQFELAAATPVHTPGWYSAELALNGVAWAIHAEFDLCLSNAEVWYPATADRLAGAHRHDIAGAVLARGLEASWKLASHVRELEATTSELSSSPILTDLRWPEWDWGVRAKRIEVLRREILKRLAKSIPDLMDDERPGKTDVPDYLGHAVHRSGEACFDALAEGDAELFDELFGLYFLGIFAIVDRLRPQVAEWTETSTAVTWMTEPIIDLIDLSGYALIFAEYHGRPELWASCRELWLRYLSDDELGVQRLRFLSIASAHHQHLFAISPRSVLRTRREMRLAGMLESLPRETSQGLLHEAPVRHESALIRKMAPSPGGMGMMYLDATDVFVGRFARTLPNAADLDFGIVQDKLSDLAELDDAGSQG